MIHSHLMIYVLKKNQLTQKEQYDLYNSSHIWDMNNDEDYE